MKDTLRRKPPEDLDRPSRKENEIQREPVADETGEKTEERHDPRVMKITPCNGLYETNGKSEVDTAAANDGADGTGAIFAMIIRYGEGGCLCKTYTQREEKAWF